MKISVVMASYLGDYQNGAKDRINKFHRAVKSFLNQTYDNKELLIVSDGCAVTLNESRKYFEYDNIKVYSVKKQDSFSGGVRSFGCSNAKGEIICYLDTDDYFGVNHIKQIADSFEYYKEQYDWMYYNDIVVYRMNPITNEILLSMERDSKVEYGSIGTSSVAHRSLPEFNWDGCNGYGHDWLFINKLINSKKPYQKISNCQYYVCHIPNSSVDC